MPSAIHCSSSGDDSRKLCESIGVRAGGARGSAAPPNFGQLRFFGQQEKIWAKPGFKDVSMFFYYFEEINIFYFNLKKNPEVGVIIQLHSLETLVA